MIRGLYTIVDNSSVPHLSHRDLALSFLEGGAKILQLRMKGGVRSPESRVQSPESRVYKVAKEIMRFKSQYEFAFIINDSLDVAKEIGADGYHGGQDDATIEEARQLLGPAKIIGHSTHSLEEALNAERQGADYVAFGAIYPTQAKGPEHPIVGVERLREVVRAVQLPVVAIGGIGRHNIKEVLATGVASVAMISALVRSGDRVEETKFFVRLF